MLQKSKTKDRKEKTMNITDEIYPVMINHDFRSEKIPFSEERCSYILSVKYGTNGLIPTIIHKNGSACKSSSGDSLCDGYRGCERIPNTDLYIVRCVNEMECLKMR